MNVRKRILTIKLIEKLDKKPDLKKEIKVELKKEFGEDSGIVLVEDKIIKAENV